MALIIQSPITGKIGIVARNALGRLDPVCDETGRPAYFERGHGNEVFAAREIVLRVKAAVEKREGPEQQRHKAMNHTPAEEGATPTAKDRTREKAERHGRFYSTGFRMDPDAARTVKDAYDEYVRETTSSWRAEQADSFDDTPDDGIEIKFVDPYAEASESIRKFAEAIRAEAAEEETKRTDPKTKFKMHPRSPRKGQR